MPLPSFATSSDYTARHGDAPDGVALDVLLSDASELIRSEAGVTWVDDDNELVDPLPGVLVGICCSIVRRAIDNPEGRTSTTTSPMNYSETNTWANPSPDMYMTKGERRHVHRAAGRGGIGSVALESGHTPPGESIYRPVAGAGEDIIAGPFLPMDEA